LGKKTRKEEKGKKGRKERKNRENEGKGTPFTFWFKVMPMKYVGKLRFDLPEIEGLGPTGGS